MSYMGFSDIFLTIMTIMKRGLRMKKKTISLLMALAMLFTSGYIPAAADNNINEDGAGVSAQSAGEVNAENFVTYASGTETELPADFVLSDGGNYILQTAVKKNIVVPAGVTADLTLEKASIETASAAPIKIEAGATLNLHLSGANTIKSTTEGYAGIFVALGGTLQIDSENDSDADSLTVTSVGKAAAIGANNGSAAYDNSAKGFGKIVINSGTINASTTGSGAPGIGAATNCTAGGGEIIINGGDVTAESNGTGAGIGHCSTTASRTKADKITITGGKVRAKSTGNYAIGGGSNLNLTISGGYIYAETAKKNSAPISADEDSVCNITGGSINGNAEPIDAEQWSGGNISTLKRITFEMPESGMTNKKLTVEPDPTWETYTDSNGFGRLYVYMSANETNASFIASYIDANGKKFEYTRKNINVSTDTEITLTKVNTEAEGQCICTDENSSVVFPSSIPDIITVNKNESKASIQLKNPDFIPNGECPKTNHSIMQPSYAIVETTSRAKIENGYLVVDYDNGDDEVITLRASMVVNDKTYTADKQITLTHEDTYKVYLPADSHVVLNNAQNGKMNVLVGGEVRFAGISQSETVYIEQSTGAPINSYISVQAGVNNPKINIKNLNINRQVGFVLQLGFGVNLTLSLEGDNKFVSNDSVIDGASDSSTLTIENSADADGEGTLECKSNYYAGIGRINKLTVNSGTVIARGGEAEEGSAGASGAGIGADSNTDAFEVEINGGRVYAYGAGNAAGIGGNGSKISHYSADTVTINGGYVYAESADKGMGIGYGGRSNGSDIIINGGSVYAVNASEVHALGSAPVNSEGKSLYLMTLSMKNADNTLLSGQRDVEYSVVKWAQKNDSDDSIRIPATTDKSGKLYLYLPRLVSERYWTRVYEGSNTYYYYAFHDSSENIGTAVSKPTAKKLDSFRIAGESAYIDEAEHSIEIEIPSAVNLESIVPAVTHEGAPDARPNNSEAKVNAPLELTSVDEDGDEIPDYYTAKYVVIGHDLEEQIYNIKLTIANDSGEGPMMLDIGKYSIIIMPDSVICGDTQMLAREDGYIIYGTTDRNTLTIQGEGLPPVTLRDLNINYSGSNAALSVEETQTEIKIEGECNITSSSSGYAVRLSAQSSSASLAITSDDPSLNILNITGSSLAEPILLGNNQMTVTGVAYSITSGTGQGIARKSGTNAAFYTDSNSYARIVDNSDDPMPITDAEGTPLYRAKITLDVKDGSDLNVCTYNDKDYYIDDNHTLCMMLPNGTHKLEVKYNDVSYHGEIVIKNKEAQTVLYRVEVTHIEPDIRVLDYHGGTVTYVLVGTSIPGHVRMAYFNSETNEYVLGEPAVEHNGECTAQLDFGVNETVETLNYNIYYTTDNGKTYQPVPHSVSLTPNTSKSSIDTFEIEGQVSSAISRNTAGENIIKVTMPFDHTLQHAYSANITGVGTCDPSSGISVAYTAASSYHYTNYSVTAIEGHIESYQVRVSTESSPKITGVKFTDPATSDASMVRVEITGDRLAYIEHAEKEENRHVYLKIDGNNDSEVEAVERVKNADGTISYFATISVPENESITSSAIHTLSARIGDVSSPWQDITFDEDKYKIEVPKAIGSNTRVSIFDLRNQVRSTIDSDNASISVMMPYDADLTSVYIDNIRMSDRYNTRYTLYANENLTSSLNINTPIDWTEAKYLYVRAENLDEKTYTVTVKNQETPSVTPGGITFEQPKTNDPGIIEVTVKGEHLDAVQYGQNPDLEVELIDSEGVSSAIDTGTLKTTDDGEYYYTVRVNAANVKNLDYVNSVFYTVRLTIGDLPSVEATERLEIPRNRYTGRSIENFNLMSGQKFPITVADDDDNETGTVDFYIPYNTDLRKMTPISIIVSTGASISPDADTERDFSKPVEYTVTADNGDVRVYTVRANRYEEQGITNTTFVKVPNSYSDVTGVALDYEGYFVAKEKDANGPCDELTLTAKCGDEPEITGTLDFSAAYGGKASGKLDLAVNNTFEDKTYNVTIMINDKKFTSNVIVPARSKRHISEFTLNGHEGKIENDYPENTGTITVEIPYDTVIEDMDIKAVLDGGDRYEASAFTLSAERAVYTAEYKVYTEGDPDPRVYTVYAKRTDLPTVDTVTVTPAEDYSSRGAAVALNGTFFDSVRVIAVASDGTEHEGTVVFDAYGEASATFTDIPKNLSTNNDAEYELRFIIDGFDSNDDEIEFKNTPEKLIVPKRTKRTINGFSINGVEGEIENDDMTNSGTVRVILPYETDLSNLSIVSEVAEHDDCVKVSDFELTSTRAQYMASYTVWGSSDPEPRYYSVYITRSGNPSVSSLSFQNPANFRGGNVTVDFGGTFFDNAKVYAVSSTGREIEGTVDMNIGTARAVINMPQNLNTESDAVYTLRFVLDGFDSDAGEVIYADGVDGTITVPRRKSLDLKLNLPEEVQEGETRYDGNNIIIDVPYCYTDRLTSVVPNVTLCDSDTVTPDINTAIDFSDLENPKTFTLTSAGETKTYTIHINLIGEDPHIEGFTVKGQYGATKINDSLSTIEVVMPSNLFIDELEPELEIIPSDSTYTPTGPVDFTNSQQTPVTFVVRNKYGIEREYKVTVIRRRSSNDNNNDSKGSGMIAGSQLNPRATKAPTPPPYVTPAPTPVPAKVTEEMRPYISGYEDGGKTVFSPEKSVKRSEITKMLALLDDNFDASKDYKSNFKDLDPKLWHYRYMNYAAEQGYISGYDDGTSRPETMITRAEFAVIMIRFMGINPKGVENHFTDLKGYDWCSDAINKLYELGVVGGYDKNEYRPAKPLTRSEAVAIINRLTGRRMTDELKKSLKNPFTDVSDKYWGYNDIMLAVCLK